jgi:hypothetical protein
MSNRPDNPIPTVISDDDIKLLQQRLYVTPFDYDSELYDEEIREFSEDEMIIVDSLPEYLEEDFPPDRGPVTGNEVPVIYEGSIIREARYVNGQFQYTVRFTVSNVADAVDYEIRLVSAQ